MTIKVFQTAKINIPVLLLALFCFLGCKKEVHKEQPSPESDEIVFEQEYVKTLKYSSGESLKLIGYKKATIPAEERAEFEAFLASSKDIVKNYFYNKKDGTLRIYFPVEGALIRHHGAFAEANYLGELSLPHNDTHDLAVVGRRQTDSITGVEGNIIKDGIIYLAKENKPDHSFGNVYVYDFGIKTLSDHSGHSHGLKTSAEKASCMTNHGGWRNCSTAFGIYKGRCTFNRNVCMDYNGWFTNCQNGKWSNFPGSDCDYALGAGHCWNEIM